MSQLATCYMLMIVSLATYAQVHVIDCQHVVYMAVRWIGAISSYATKLL